MKGYDCLAVSMIFILVSSFGMVTPNTGYNSIPMPASGNSQESHIMSATHAQITENVIEPLTFSTLIGGLREDYAKDVAIDDDGYVYVTGKTFCSDFPTHNALDSSFDGESDCFLAKLSPDGSELIYSTFIGGSGIETAYAIEVDGDGNVYLCGSTSSSDFPLTGGYDTVYNASGDAFVMKINSAGTDIIWSTLLGGAYGDVAYDLTIDDSDSVYVTGYTQAPEFPYMLLGELGSSDCFVVKLNPSGTALEISTLMSGGRAEEGRAIAVDGSGNIFVTGSIEQPYWPYEWPVVNAFQDTFAGATDAFVAKLNASGTGLFYNTFLGGSSHELPRAMALDDLGNVYIGGTTSSSNFPRVNAIDNDLEVYDAFVTKINATGNGLIFSTFIGGAHVDYGEDLVIDDQYNVYLVGTTESIDIPLVNEYDDSVVNFEGMIIKLNSTGNGVPYATVLGAGFRDDIRGVALDESGNIIVAGSTREYGFPNTTSFCSSEFSIDAFVTSLHDMSDRDNDGLPDFDESIIGTNPDNADSDSDLMPDGYEVQFGLNPLVNDADGDFDGDGLTNYEEFLDGTYPNETDSDDDTLNDYDELNVYHTNPLSNDTENDGMPDGWEVANGLDPTQNDAGNDADDDGLSNLDEYRNGTDPQVADSDGDGMNDGDEVAAGLDPLVPRSAEPFIQEYMVYVVLIPLIAFTVIVIILQARIEPFIEQQQNRNLRGGNALQGGDE